MSVAVQETRLFPDELSIGNTRAWDGRSFATAEEAMIVGGKTISKNVDAIFDALVDKEFLTTQTILAIARIISTPVLRGCQKCI